MYIVLRGPTSSSLRISQALSNTLLMKRTVAGSPTMEIPSAVEMPPAATGVNTKLEMSSGSGPFFDIMKACSYEIDLFATSSSISGFSRTSLFPLCRCADTATAIWAEISFLCKSTLVSSVSIA